MTVDELDRLLRDLGPEMKRDLAHVCESHNLDDLEDTKKYKISQPCGNSDDETVNLQYVAVLLRTADLLQITADRAPSVLFKIINPTDPVSQLEWAKQNAVRRVRARPPRDRDDVVGPLGTPDTVEVIATFESEDGFFGLTSYLAYAEKQLRRSYDVIKTSKKDLVRDYRFPWRDIDTSGIEARGFLTERFGFELDQARILYLLTGHTLYNDSNVAIRELVQNAIDAVRLRAEIDKKDSSVTGSVAVSWDSGRAELEVLDNGTGMTQEIIQNHLLKVGSSRYQDPKFRDEHPNFSPISRFGIGVLSAFMIADSVEIITSSPHEQEARQISLRSVHGQYLIRLLNKQTDPAAMRVGRHGTSVRLKLRATARKVDVLGTVRHWVQYPRCRVEVNIDGDKPITVGFASPKAAIEHYLK